MFWTNKNKAIEELSTELNNLIKKVSRMELDIELLKTSTTNLRAFINRKIGEVNKDKIEEKDLYNGMLLPDNGIPK